MEINANIYIITDSQTLMEKTVAILSRETDAIFVWETVEPHPILPLTRTWYTSDTRTGSTTDPGGWENCLRGCADLLKNRGAVIMRFWSPDHPEDYCEYANTIAGEMWLSEVDAPCTASSGRSVRMISAWSGRSWYRVEASMSGTPSPGARRSARQSEGQRATLRSSTAC